MRNVYFILLSLTIMSTQQTTPETKRIVTQSTPKGWSDVWAETPCHYDLPAFHTIQTNQFDERVLERVMMGIEKEEELNTEIIDFKNGNMKLKIDFWRTGSNVFARASIQKNVNEKFVEKYRLVWHAQD